MAGQAFGRAQRRAGGWGGMKTPRERREKTTGERRGARPDGPCGKVYPGEGAPGAKRGKVGKGVPTAVFPRCFPGFFSAPCACPDGLRLGLPKRGKASGASGDEAAAGLLTAPRPLRTWSKACVPRPALSCWRSSRRRSGGRYCSCLCPCSARSRRPGAGRNP